MRLTQIAAAAALLSGSIASVSHAQPPAVGDVMSRAMEIVAELEERGTCDLSLHGAPQLDETTGRWLIAYSGVGPACEDTGTALQREGAPSDITFFRRPNPDEVKALIGRMRAAVRRGFDCLVTFNGEPRFDDESSTWTVRYYTSGYQCDDASEEIERQGREFRVVFQRRR